MLTTIKNNTISITADTKGAELYSMEASNGISYLWKGDSAFWKGRAPILFPIVGALRGGRAKSKEGDILLPRHGFARSAEWALESNDEQSLTYRLCSTAETKAVYPYDFEIRVRYIIGDNTVTTAISVHNTGDTTMPFCVGGHPGFHVPLVEGEKFENYLVEFDCPESADCPGVDLESGLILDRSRRRFLAEQTTFRLDHELFRNDALVFDQLKSRSVRLISEKSGHGVRMDFAGLDFFAVWTPVTDSPFVCLEPWTGTATQESEDDVFEHKQGIRLLAPGGEDAVSFTVTVF